MTWNYRIVTHIHNGVRLFSIAECYYEEGQSTPSSYIDPREKNILSNWEDVNDVRGTHRLVAHALEKPILDLDNWPKTFIP